jgi:4-amino-4-deoxy-L-arabinose transferase-like glycosyltransferase
MGSAPDPTPAGPLSGTRALVAVLAVAGLLRIWGTFDQPVKFVDEQIHVRSALSLLETGAPQGGDWAHPPLHGLVLQATIAALGDRPLGWRIANVALGVLSVLLLHLVAARLYPGSGVPLVAAALLAVDPSHALYSRTAYMEVPLACAFLLFLLLLLEYTERQRATLHWAGLALGLTVATKANYALCVAVAVGYALRRSGAWGDRPVRRAVEVGLALGLLPASVYLLSFAQWFGRGHTLPELVRMRLDAAWTLASLRPSSFMFPDVLEASGGPRAWFLLPASFGLQLGGDGESGRFLLDVASSPLRLLVLPALLVVCATAWRRRDARELRVPALFAGAYLLPLALERPVVGHSAVAVLPFAWLLVARAVALLADRSPAPGRFRAAFLAGALAWGAYAFPLYSATAVPLAPYRPILSSTRFLGPHP